MHHQCPLVTESNCDKAITVIASMFDHSIRNCARSGGNLYQHDDVIRHFSVHKKIPLSSTSCETKNDILGYVGMFEKTDFIKHFFSMRIVF